jgi:hypothetical protein
MGGPLDLYKKYFEYRPVAVGLKGFAGRELNGNLTPSGWLGYQLYQLSDQLVLDGQVWSKLNDVDLDALGTSGWSKFKPGKPGADMGQFFGELNRVPSLDLLLGAAQVLVGYKKRALEALTNGGSRYLDLEFGWKPFVKELQEAWKFTHKVDKALEQLRRDNGKRVRRGGRISYILTPTVTAGPVTVGSPLRPVGWGEMYGSNYGTRTWKSHAERTVWFKAGFRYNIPDIGSLQWTQKATRALWGTRLTPELAYELMPWSWLIDWFSNLGDVISNLVENAAENLTADYAFVMADTKLVTTMIETAHVKHGFQTHAEATWVSAELDFVRHYKQRRQASPYNFGISTEDLSDAQRLILAALGISRLGW